ncbi:MAG TPA: IS21 family transposase [Kofleriaceae bacterium]|nr:IS21 family transposase [Kofleriaceae bacterium]
MIDMVRRHEIQVLRRAGHSLVETAKLVGVSQSSVQRVEAEAAVVSFDSEAARKKQRIGRPSKAEPFRSFLVSELMAQPDVLAVELLRRARNKGYTGGKSALYKLVKELRPERPRPIVRFAGLPGEFSQHDFGEVDVKYLDGRIERVHFFASRLKYSRWVQVSLVENQQVEALVRAMVDHFAAWGGLPLLAVFDRPKTIALKWSKDGKVVDWNPTFGAVALDLGLGVELCWPHSPEQKGSVENLVGWVKGSFFKQRRFVDKDDLLCQLAEWHEDVNTKRPSRATRVIPAERLAEEKPRLRALRVKPGELALRIPAHVGPTGYVVHDTHPYSMPPDALGLPATLYLYRDRVRIVAGRHSAEHERKFARDESSTLPEHRAKRVAAVSGKRAKRYMKREHLVGLGEDALTYITEVVHRRPKVWLRDVDELHDLLEVHGDHAMRVAFARGLAAETYGAEYIAHYLCTPNGCATQRELFS